MTFANQNFCFGEERLDLGNGVGGIELTLWGEEIIVLT
jgi:hypothetical protein